MFTLFNSVIFRYYSFDASHFHTFRIKSQIARNLHNFPIVRKMLLAPLSNKLMIHSISPRFARLTSTLKRMRNHKSIGTLFPMDERLTVTIQQKNRFLDGVHKLDEFFFGFSSLRSKSSHFFCFYC